MALHGAYADVEGFSDFLVSQSCCQQAKHVQLACAQERRRCRIGGSAFASVATVSAGRSLASFLAWKNGSTPSRTWSMSNILRWWHHQWHAERRGERERRPGDVANLAPRE